MFWNEEEIQPVVDAAVSVFGPQAQYFPEPYVFVRLVHPKFGIIWYGDVEGTPSRVGQLTQSLVQKTGESIFAEEHSS
jgi:hypothetical protein